MYLCWTGVLLWPPGRKPWAACVHFHHTYSTDRDDLYNAWRLLLLLHSNLIPSRWSAHPSWRGGGGGGGLEPIKNTSKSVGLFQYNFFLFAARGIILPTVVQSRILIFLAWREIQLNFNSAAASIKHDKSCLKLKQENVKDAEKVCFQVLKTVTA